MKKLFTIVAALLFSFNAFSQAYSSPESIEFDYANNRWLIANNAGNNILARNSTTGAVTVFAPCSGGPHGIEIVNDTLYVNAGGNIKLFNINTAAAIGTITMGASFLNGLTHDATYLYSTDFSAKKFTVSTLQRVHLVYLLQQRVEHLRQTEFYTMPQTTVVSLLVGVHLLRLKLWIVQPELSQPSLLLP